MATASGLDAKAVAFGANVDEEVARIWKEVEARVVQMAGGDPSKIKKNLDMNDVLGYLDQAQSKDKKSAEKYGTVKNIFNRTLQCIQTVGGIVADGASYVFAPAGQCYNALTFVIQAWQGYEGIFESLAGLLEKCIEFLDRLTYYAASGMDSKLTKVACQHLQIFVEICDHTLRLRSKRSKFAAFMKQMFLNDDGVQHLLGAMKNLVDKEHGLVSAQTWKSSNEAAANSRDGLSLTRKMHTSLAEDRNQKQHDKDVLRWKQTIADALELDRAKVEGDIHETWDKMWKRHKSNLLEGSGEWLIQDNRFTSWVSGSSDSKKILALEGEDGAGKTLLASNVVLHLRKMKAVEASGSRVIVAHNFLEIDSKSTTNANDANVISRHVMCQLALADEPVMKSVAHICEKAKYFDSPLDMWTQLLLENEDLLDLDVTLFIVLDGLGANAEVLINFLQKFSENPLVKRTHILLTGKRRLFETIDRAGGVKMERIVLGQVNSKDLDIFIKGRMDSMDILKDTARPGVSDMRTKILTALKSSTGGDYYKVGRVLDNIAMTDDVEEINSLLESAGSMRPDQIESDIEKLNQERTSKEIAEINEMILWVNAARNWLTPLSMESALGIRFPGASASLMSMEAKIASKYTIFSTESGFVRYKVAGIEEKVPLKKRDAADDQSSSGFKEIQPAEISIIKHYLTAVCPADLYQKFGFDEFFELKMTRKGNYICRDPDNAQASMVLRCIQCLANERTSKTERLLDYAASTLHFHLKDTDLSLTDRSLKAEVGLALVRLFTEQYALDSLFGFHLLHEDVEGVVFGEEDLPESWKVWILSDQGVKSIAKWLRDSAVIEHVKDSPLVTGFNAPDANRHLALFSSAVTTAAEDLFRRDTTRRETLRAYVFLKTLLNKDQDASKKEGTPSEAAENTADATNQEGQEKQEDDADDNPIYSPSLDDIQWLEDWAKQRLQITERDSTWEAQAVLLLSYVAGDKIEKSSVEERARKALEVNSESWAALCALSHVVESKEECFNLRQKAFDKLIGDTEWQSQRGHKGILAAIIYDLGNKLWEIGEKQEEAIAMYSNIFGLGDSIDLFYGFAEVLQKYAEAGLWEPMVAFFERFLVEPEDGPNNVGEFLWNKLLYSEATFFPLLVQMIEASERYDLLDTLFARAIGKAVTKGDQGGVFTIRYFYGKTLVEIKGHEEAGIKIWEEYLDEVTDDLREWAINSTIMYTIPALMELATAKDVDPARAQEFFAKIEAAYENFVALGKQNIESTVAFAQYFRHQGNTIKAKQILQPRVTEALEMLSDDRTDNDAWSFYMLCQIFSVMRDFPNLIACYDLTRQAMTTAHEEYEQNMAKYREEDELLERAMANGETFHRTILAVPEEPSIALCFCDGCGETFMHASEFWTCLSCGGTVQLDEACYQKLKEGTFGPRICNKDHEHFWIPKRDVEVLDAVPNDSVMVGERTVTFEAWKDEIRAEYVDVSAS
ncbi:hypothetical protein F53441_4131 [Fusarium austroafricanum]|uniref:Fungal STAND N-terminal Goodbye domain-containing protein n=1 Tax=Fusarium austroafricanum TaxID=2364996 RepID=A0A8H4NVV3_9HYPO|nr:hypothetical protein F53441_4131 [Fusarium austroafricanum]